jgi:hypothetical protein
MSRYQKDEKYKEYFKEYQRTRYRERVGIKKLQCVECKQIKRLSILDNCDYKYNKKKFICPECLPENKVEQYKNPCGRRKKNDFVEVKNLII